MRTRKHLIALIGMLALGTGGSALAQEAPSAGSNAAPAAPPSLPARGSTMDTVQAKFGAPSQKLDAVGRPPITRWEYPGYVVYFENDRVLHTVLLRSAS